MNSLVITKHKLVKRALKILKYVFIIINEIMWLQHDGCPAFYAEEVSDWLNRKFENGWIPTISI